MKPAPKPRLRGAIVRRFAVFSLALLCAVTLPAQQVSAPAKAVTEKKEAPLVLDAFQVSTTKDTGYRAGNAVSAMRMNVPVADIPQNISVYDRAWIEDIMAFDASDVAAYEPAFINNFPPRSGGQFAIRGFNSSSFLQDGISQNYGFGTTLPLINIERVEILKGPSAVLYGGGAIGGTINRISKRPEYATASQYRLITGINEVNSDPIMRFEGDWTGELKSFPFLKDLVKGSRVAYRLNALVEDSGMYRVGSGVKEYTVAPSLLWQITPKTSITAHAIVDAVRITPMWEQPVSVINGKYVYGQVRPDGKLATYDTGKYSAVPDADKGARKANNLGLALDIRHSFTDNLQFRAQINHQDFEQNLHEYFPDQLNRYAVNLDPVSGVPVIGYTDAAGVFQLNKVVPNTGTAVGLDYLLPRDLRHLRNAPIRDDMRSEIVWKASHPYATHNILVGSALSYTHGDNYRAQLNVDRANPQNAAPWQLVSVFYGDGGGPIPHPRNALVPTFNNTTQSAFGDNWPLLPSLNQDSSFKAGNWALYISDLVGLFDDRVYVTAGHRYTEDRNDTYNHAIPVGTAPVPSRTRAKSGTWSYGTVVHVLKDKSLSLFFNANQAFEPVTTISQDDYKLPPTTGDQVEGGLKFDMLGGRLGGTLSIYHIVRQNIPIQIATGIFRPNGEGFESDGWELEVNYNITSNWQLFAGAGAIEMYDRSRAATYTLKGVPNIPKNSYSLFTRYEFRQGKLKGFFGNFGVVYHGDRYTDWTSRPDLAWVIPGAVRYDAAIGYGWRTQQGSNYSAVINVANLTNADTINKSRYWDANPDTLRQIRFELRAKY